MRGLLGLNMGPRRAVDIYPNAVFYNTKLSFFADGIGVALQLIFIFGGWLSIYNSWILSLSSSFIIQGLLFFIFLGAAKFIINIPFDLYETFHIEEKYGFNTKTLSLWITDAIKSIVISIILFGIIGSAAFWIIYSFYAKAFRILPYRTMNRHGEAMPEGALHQSILEQLAYYLKRINGFLLCLCWEAVHQV